MYKISGLRSKMSATANRRTSILGLKQNWSSNNSKASYQPCAHLQPERLCRDIDSLTAFNGYCTVAHLLLRTRTTVLNNGLEAAFRNWNLLFRVEAP